MIKDFGFIIPQNCQFGMGALKKLPDFLKAAGSDNVMLISDRGLKPSVLWTKSVRSSRVPT
ncbi:MAG: hypothetical protein ACLR1T_15910 [Evtepia gabavorous]